MIEKNKKTVLKNGTRVLWIPQADGDTVGVGFALNAGPYFEKSNEAGISHVVEHLISRSGEGKENLGERVHGKGALFDASTSVSQTFFHLYSFYNDLPDLTKILIEGIYKTEFDINSLNFSKESVLSEMAYAVEALDYEILRTIMWKDELLTKPLMGSKESIMSFDLEAVSEYHKKYYCSQNTSVVLISKKLPDGFEDILGAIPSSRKIDLEVNTSFKKPSYRIFQSSSLHTTLTIGFPTLGYKNLGEDRHIFNLSATILKSLFNSFLGKYGLIYEVDWTWNVFPETGDFIIVIEEISDAHLLNLVEKFKELMTYWPSVSLSDNEFESIKKHRILKIKIGQSLTDALPLFTKNFSSSESAHSYKEALKVYESATLADTLKVLDRVLLEKKPYLVINMGINTSDLLGKINQSLQEFFR